MVATAVDVSNCSSLPVWCSRICMLVVPFTPCTIPTDCCLSRVTTIFSAPAPEKYSTCTRSLTLMSTKSMNRSALPTSTIFTEQSFDNGRLRALTFWPMVVLKLIVRCSGSTAVT